MTGQGAVVVRVYACTDVGRTRDHNEDAFVVADLTAAVPIQFQKERTEEPGDRGAVLMVADGMGGAAAGEIASSMAVDIVLRELRVSWLAAPSADPATFATALVSATTTANDRIHRFAAEHPEYRGMGTTATVAGVLGDTLYIAQVGDSRAYLVRNGVARQLTKDQSLMQRLIEAGEITAEEAEVSERRNIILQALGPESAIKVDITHQQLRRGDTLVLCSDGLSGLVRDREIAQVVNDNHDLRAVCMQLIAEANERGGPDNITVVAAQFDGSALADVAESDEVGHHVFPVGEPDLAADPEPAADSPDALPTGPTGPAEAGALNPAPEPPRRLPKTDTLEIAPPRLRHGTQAWTPRLALVVGAIIMVIALIYLFGRRQ